MNKFLIGGAGAAAGVGLISAATATYVAKAAQGRATGDLQGFLDSNVDTNKDIAVFVGASMVRGRASVDFVDIVRHECPEWEVVNAGENGNTVADVADRLASIKQAKPKAVVLLVGTNDVQLVLNPESAAASKQTKLHGQQPDLPNFTSVLTEIVRNLQEAGVKVGLCSLPPLGQDLSTHPNQVVREFNAVIEGVTFQQGSTFIDVYAAMARALEEAGVANTKPFTGKWQIGARSLAQHFIVGRTYDQIAEREGLLLSPDYIHLNTKGAEIVAGLCADFLSNVQTANDPPLEG